MKKWLFSLILLLATSFTYAQNNLIGQVVNAETGEALQHAHIYIKELNRGLLSNDTGFFFLKEIESNKLSVYISYVGFTEFNQQIDLSIGNTYSFPLSPSAFTSSTYVVTATRNKQEVSMIPARVDVIDEERIKSQSASNTDNYLQSVSGIYVNRSGGIFSRNASVSLRGLSSSARTLILLDGVPLNHASGGTINWHMIPVQDIRKIEIIKGPASAIYGMHAMGGVINILTNSPESGLGAEAEFGFGNFNTSAHRITVSNLHEFNKKNLYWSFNVSNKKGDGYFVTPDNLLDWYDAPLSIRETKASIKVGSKLSPSSHIENNFFYYDDIRFSGNEFYEPRGSFEKFNTLQNSLNYSSLFGKTQIDVVAFAHQENYYRLNENINNTELYKLSETFHKKDDIGLFLKVNRRFFKNHILTSGIDLKEGLYDGKVIYRTTTDILNYQGNMLFAGIYAQDEFSLWKNRLSFNLGLRFDHVVFSDGAFGVENPTGETGFIDNESEKYSTKNWQSFSPKVGFRYKFWKSNSFYASVSKGFMPPKTDDLVRSGKISKGFKIANSELQAETLTNYEAGFSLNPSKKINIKTSFYKSFGKNFLYLLQTGDSIDMGDDTYRQIYKRRNIAEVEISGFEIDLNYTFSKALNFQANYTFSQPIISAYKDDEQQTNSSLVGKYLAETPFQQVFSSICWNNKIVNTSVSYNLIGKQFADDLNEFELQRYYLIDLRFSRNFGNHISTNLDIQNILNQKYLDRKGNQSIGRFVLLSIQYKI